MACMARCVRMAASGSEGLLLALMPEALKRVVAEILTQPARALRLSGLVSAAIGLAVVWLVRG
jgi:uncharacterized protein YjeT (DUF2065 family)